MAFSKNDPVLYGLNFPYRFLSTKTLKEIYPIIKSIQEQEDLVSEFRNGFNKEHARWNALDDDARIGSFAPIIHEFVENFADFHGVKY